jgi:hypothetical protein
LGKVISTGHLEPQDIARRFNILHQSERGVDIAADDEYHRVTRYALLAFISLKMELSWRSSPVGKVHKDLPRFS